MQGDVAQAAWQGNPDLLHSSANADGAEVDAPDHRGYTALHIVSSKVDRPFSKPSFVLFYVLSSPRSNFRVSNGL